MERYYFSAYGSLHKVTPSGTPLGNVIDVNSAFSGRMFDGESGHMYFRTRYYSARLGRFLQRDKLGHIDSGNLFAFASSRPTAFNDPFGTCSSACSDAKLRVAQMLEKTLADYFDRNGQHQQPGIGPNGEPVIYTWTCKRPKVTCCYHGSSGRGCKYCKDHPGLAGAQAGNQIVICAGNFPDQDFVQNLLHEYQHSIDECIHREDRKKDCFWDICSEISANVNSGQCEKSDYACIRKNIKDSFTGTGSKCGKEVEAFLRNRPNMMRFCAGRRPHHWPKSPVVD